MSSEDNLPGPPSSGRNNRARPPLLSRTQQTHQSSDEVPSPFGAPPSYPQDEHSPTSDNDPEAEARALFFAHQLRMADRNNSNNNHNNGSSSAAGNNRPQNMNYRVNVRAGIEVRGHGSIVGAAPGNAGQLTHGTIRDIATSEQMRIGSGDRNLRNYEIVIDAGVTIVGNQNVVGHGLQDVARLNQQGRGQGQGQGQGQGNGRGTSGAGGSQQVHGDQSTAGDGTEHIGGGQGPARGGNQQSRGGRGSAADGGGSRRNN